MEDVADSVLPLICFLEPLSSKYMPSVCTENVVRIDLVTESPNHPGRWSRCYPFFSIC